MFQILNSNWTLFLHILYYFLKENEGNDTNVNLLIPIFLQPDVVHFWNFKLSILLDTKIYVLSIYIYKRFTPSGCKDKGIRKFKFEENSLLNHPLYTKKSVEFEWYTDRTWLLLQKESFLVETGEFTP